MSNKLNLQALLGADAIALAQRPLAEASTLPPAAYIDARTFELEKAAIFQRGWQCVGRVQQVREPGEYFCVDLQDQPIVVARDRQGELHALSRVCVHRGMPVASGAGQATRFVCPYHKWTYELDGRLRSAPMMDGASFQTTDCQLPRLSLEVWQGFIFVNLDPDAQPLVPQLSGLNKLVENYGFESMEVATTLHYDSPWNWKILVENFIEAYHHIGTHKDSLEPIYPARDSSVPDNTQQPWVYLDMPGITDGEGHTHHLFAAAVFPTFMFAASSRGGGAWYQMEVDAHDHFNLSIHGLVPQGASEQMDEADIAAVQATLQGVHEEDIGANLGVWQGLKAPLAQAGRLSTFEAAIWQLNQIWLRYIREYEHTQQQ